MPIMQPALTKYLGQQAPQNPQDLSALDMYMATPEGQAALGQAEQQPAPAMALAPVGQATQGTQVPVGLDKYQQLAQASDVKNQDQLRNLQEYINEYAQKRPQGVDFSAPAALLASMDSKYQPLAQAMEKNKPANADQRLKDVIDLQSKLVGSQSKMGAQELNALKSLLGLNISQQKADADTKNAGLRGESVDLRKDEQAARAVDKVTNDKELEQHVQRLQGANRITAQLDAAASGQIVDTSQLLNDLNVEYVALITGRNNAPEGSAERSSYDTASSKMSRVMQQLSADPKSINSPKIVEQLRNSVEDLRSTYQKNVDVRADRLKRDYAHNAAANKAIQGAIADVKQQYGHAANKKAIPAAQENAVIHGPGKDGLDNLSDEELLQKYNQLQGQ